MMQHFCNSSVNVPVVTGDNNVHVNVTRVMLFSSPSSKKRQIFTYHILYCSLTISQRFEASRILLYTDISKMPLMVNEAT